MSFPSLLLLALAATPSQREARSEVIDFCCRNFSSGHFLATKSDLLDYVLYYFIFTECIHERKASWTTGWDNELKQRASKYVFPKTHAWLGNQGKSFHLERCQGMVVVWPAMLMHLLIFLYLFVVSWAFSLSVLYWLHIISTHCCKTENTKLKI